MASHPSTPQDQLRRRGPRTRGARCSHSSRLDVPLLDMGSTMTAQLAHERNGLLLSHAHSSDHSDRSRILNALRRDSVDLSKAQSHGHCNQLTAKLAECLVHHVLFAKGQLPEPVSLLRKRRQIDAAESRPSTRKRSRSSSARQRKESKLLARLDQLRLHLEQAAQQLAAFVATNGEGPSRHPFPGALGAVSPNDLRLLVVIGASAAMPREVFVLDLIQAIGRCTSAHDAAQHLLNSCDDPDDQEHENVHGDDDSDACLANLGSDASEQRRSMARDKTSTNWERKLVRLLVSDERLEDFMASPLAPTRVHLFLSAPASFRCAGWSARNHLDFDLDALCEPTSDSETRWHKSACGSSSSVADSALDDSASEHVGESSMSSISQDSSRPPSAADKQFGVGSSPTEWLPTCSSPLAATDDAQSLDVSRTGSSLGSSTVYGHVDPSVEASEPRRRSREPRAGSLLSRNLIRARTRHASLAASDSSSVRSLPVSLKRAPRCAGVQIDFADPAVDATSAPAPSPAVSTLERRCWFQCDAVLEGFR
ncbi:uncharacterized protein PAN0_086c6658 [Moesziomyces antarcticus]|uniref:Uncharacterized protein n=2 Tax=Pseudozyma antarctica TaxID=84753 RepID=A0A081CP12_PSEA2|nr:uncharacterized protein PAN0_086c6658 [Moesziomyces antarcticus]GAK68408.1 conserved hypothetical protein [Moesziomyces antarcticus]